MGGRHRTHPHQWVCWRYGKVRSNGRREKLPVSPLTGLAGDAQDSELWGSYAEAVAGKAVHGCDGIGFVLTGADPFCAIDLDDVINPATGAIEEGAQAIVNSIDTYWEVSPSSTGLRGLLKGTKPGSRSRGKASNGVKVELYDSKRFITITGLAIENCEEVTEQQQALTAFYRWLFGDDQPENIVTQSGAGFAGADKELLAKARNVGQWKMFRKLFDNGNWQHDFPSQSEADLKLATMLAFWCGPDGERIDRLFRRSKLCRDKWDEQRGDKTYGQHTIYRATANCPYFYQGNVTITDRVQVELQHLYGWLLAHAWNYRAGPTDRHVYRALLDHASKHGTEHPQGIVVSMSGRNLGLEAGIGSRDTVAASLERLAGKHGVVEVLQSGKGRKATRFLLKGITQDWAINNTGYVYGLPLSTRVRNHSPSGTYSTIGKRNAQILDTILGSTTPVPLVELARLLRVRKYNLMRNLVLLEQLELIEYRDGGYTTPADIEERMERELQESGCTETYELHRERVELEQEAFRTRKQYKVEAVPKRMQMKKPTVSKQADEPIWRRDKPVPDGDFLSDYTKEYRNHILYMFWHEDECACRVCEREREAVRSSEEHHKQLYPNTEWNDSSWLNDLLTAG